MQQIQGTGSAFAAILADGSVLTWGDEAYGGDSSAVQDQLRGGAADSGHRCSICCDSGRWIRRDMGSWSTWRRQFSSSRSLKGVQQIQGTGSAFAAILADGSVVTWGHAAYGGDSSAVQDQLKGVQQIQGTGSAFAAILADGSVVTWGHAAYGGDSSAVQDQLKGVQQIQASFEGAFAAILTDGSVITWGDEKNGGDSSAVRDQLRGVQQIQATSGAFAAMLADGSVVTWGSIFFGGDSLAVGDQLRFV